MTPQPEAFDAVVIGTGQGGKPLAGDLAEAGRRTAIIERGHVGGTCVNVGCTPTKTMVASGRVAYLVNRAGDYGVRVGSVDVDMRAVRQRKRDIVESFRSGSVKRLESTDNLELIRGEASFTGPHTVKVSLADGGERMLQAETIFINAGARPRVPDLAGLDEIDALDSTSIMELAEVPEHLVVLGGGYVGIEFAQLFRRLGARVTIVQRGGQLLEHEDDDVAEAVAEILREDGIEVLLRREAVRVAAAGDGIEVALKQGGDARDETGDAQDDSGDAQDRLGNKKAASGDNNDAGAAPDDGDPSASTAPTMLSASHLLVAAGRVPNTDRLALEAAGVDVDERGHIIVNERLETSVAGVYALGDVKGGPAFTHIAYDDYRILRDNLLDDGGASTEDRLVPYTVFMDPELGRIGLTEREAKEQGIDYRIATMPMSHVARALETDETRGLMKVLVNERDGAILGCAILGIQGGELATMIQIAMMGKLHYRELREGIFSHPTLAEAFNNLFSSLEEPSS